MPFKAKVPIRFNQADPGGILFFGNVYPIAHDVYEDFVKALGFTWNEWFANPEWAVPIRHSSCEYFAPMFAGKMIDVEVKVERVGDSSFTLRYEFKSDRPHCKVELVHTFIDKKTFGKRTMPSEIRGKLTAYQSESGPTK